MTTYAIPLLHQHFKYAMGSQAERLCHSLFKISGSVAKLPIVKHETTIEEYDPRKVDLDQHNP